MFPMLMDGPAIEPVSLDEAKLWLKISGDEEDDLLRSLIVAARLMVEAEIGQVLLGQTWRLTADACPPTEQIPVRIGRILGVIAARIFPAEGAAVPLPTETIEILRNCEPQALIVSQRPVPGRLRAGIEIDLRLGYGEAPADVPEPIRLAIRRLVTLWFEDRGEGSEANDGLTASIRGMLRPFRPVRL